MNFNGYYGMKLKSQVYYGLKEINDNNSLDILNEDTYKQIINGSNLAFGECRYDYIDLTKIDLFLKENNKTIEDINRLHYHYNRIRNQFPSLKSIKLENVKDVKNKNDFNKLSGTDKNLYMEYVILKNNYNLTFFNTRKENQKNIKIKNDKIVDDLNKIYIYIIIHHIREIENIKNNNGGNIPNLSDMNIVLNKDYSEYQKQKEICRMDTFIHIFSHLIISGKNKYVSTDSVKLFGCINIIVREKERLLSTGKIISLSDFNKGDNNYFTDYLELEYMVKRYNLKELKLLQSVVYILNEKLKEGNNERN